MKFDRPNDPRPMTAARAVRRGILCIYGPGGLFVFASSAFALAVVNLSLVCSAILWVLGLCGAWLWWSYFIPQWRAWALSRGADPVELHTRAVRFQLEWPRGSSFERTEIRRNGR